MKSRRFKLSGISSHFEDLGLPLTDISGKEEIFWFIISTAEKELGHRRRPVSLLGTLSRNKNCASYAHYDFVRVN